MTTKPPLPDHETFDRMSPEDQRAVADRLFVELSVEGRRAMVGVTYHAFGAERARWLAKFLGVRFEHCAEAIAKHALREH